MMPSMIWHHRNKLTESLNAPPSAFSGSTDAIFEQGAGPDREHPLAQADNEGAWGETTQGVFKSAIPP